MLAHFFLGIIIGFVIATLVGVVYLKNKKSSDKLRLKVSQVKPGQRIKIEHQKAKYTICTATCLSNDPTSNKILIEILWTSDETKEEYKQEYVLDYKGYELKNFHLLNKINFKIQTDSEIEESEKQEMLEKLKSQLENLLDKEEYLKARQIQNKINSILKIKKKNT